MAVYGYARVSTADQDLGIQIAALEAAGATMIRSEKISGTSTAGREQLRLLLDFIREGDTLVVTRIDRLARSVSDLYAIVNELETKKASIKATEQSIDTSTAAGRAFLGMLAIFASFETEIRRERQMEGISKAKAEGKYKGQPPSIDRDAIIELKARGAGVAEICRLQGCSRASVYRILTETGHGNN